MSATPFFFGGEIFRRRGYPPNHPLAIPRVGTVIELARQLGWLPPVQYHESPMATPAELARFHDPDYVAAVRRAQESGRISPEDRDRHNIGTLENPWFNTMYDRAATCCGGSIAAARAVIEGGIAFAPAGGTHHARRDRASGFCYFNDPVLAIYALLDAGLRVFYADIDGHHGDGVEIAFADEPRVFMVSVHEAGRWPKTGTLADRGGGNARNLPVPAGFNDSEMDLVIADAFLPLAKRFRPDAVVVTCGVDALADDPLTRLALSNRALWHAVENLSEIAPRVVVLGGGGYNPWATARCWTGVWGMLNKRAVPAGLLPQAQAMLRAIEWDFDDGDGLEGNGRPETWFTTIADAPRPGPIRGAVRQCIGSALAG